MIIHTGNSQTKRRLLLLGVSRGIDHPHHSSLAKRYVWLDTVDRRRAKPRTGVRMRHVQTQYRIAPEATWYKDNHNIHGTATSFFFRVHGKDSGVDRRGKDKEKARWAVIGCFQHLGGRNSMDCPPIRFICVWVKVGRSAIIYNS